MSAHVDVELTKPRGRQFLARALGRRLKTFEREEEGSILIFSLFLLIMILFVSGMAVDLMRSETERARLQSTLDRAILAGASLEQTLDSEDVVRDYFLKAGLSEYLDDVQVIQGQNSKTVIASASMQVNTFFMKMLGVPQLHAPAAGTAEESLTNIEVSLIVDVSGSMGSYSSSGQRKIQDLRDAASDFVYLMQCNPDYDVLDENGNPTCTVEEDTVSISLIPYAEQVLVGESLIQKFNVTEEHTSSSCADFADADFSSTSISTTASLQRAGQIDNRTNYGGWNSNRYASQGNRTCQTNSYRKILPFSNDYEELQDAIDDLDYGGYTSIDLGMKWGTALLDPEFHSVVEALITDGDVTGAFDDRPYAFNERSMQKVIVLMTDGENTTQYALKPGYYTGASPVYKNTSSSSRYSAYNADTGLYWHTYTNSWQDHPYGDGNYQSCTTTWWGGTTCSTIDEPGSAVQLTYEQLWQSYNVDWVEETFTFLPAMTDYYGYDAKNTRLQAICDAALDEDIEIFTIGFETSEASNIVLQNCASSESHHFDVDGLELSEAFVSIAREIHELRLTN